MFVAAVIRLKLNKASVLPPYMGRSTHGCFFSLLHEADSDMAEALHKQETNWSKGFTVSSLMGLPAPMGRQIVAPEGQGCALRITSINSELSQLLVEKVLPNLPDSLIIGEHIFSVEGWDTSTEAHPLAGVANPAEMAANHMLVGQTPSDRITLRFASPTTFSSSGREMPLPLPQMVFGGYLDRWNAHVSMQLDKELRRFVEECVVVHRYNLATVPVRLEFGAPLTG
ncbi:MAG TPA: CRISPR system precrRNA processing endoribonuclease RAMP protein Cas6, partial [Chloroflexia bacterium]|nr:CRISPR system precrRNA processing endoribonuclease RAMP protein Cas6 [Chloroflexia bacterium]